MNIVSKFVFVYLLLISIHTFADPTKISMTEPSQWRALEFRKIPANKIRFTGAGLSVVVNSSASPLIHKLNGPIHVKSIKVKGQVRGAIPLKGQQGQKGNDDFVLRVGLVVKGSKSLNFFQRKMAPKWVLELHSLAEKDSGVDRIEFFNLVQDKDLVGTQRVHPMSDLISENFVWSLNNRDEKSIEKAVGQDFTLEHKFKAELEVLAIWLSIDGDDTGATFETIINNIELN